MLEKIFFSLVYRFPLWTTNWLLKRGLLTQNRYRRVRAYALKTLTNTMVEILKRVGYQHTIHLSADKGVMVESEGICLSVDGTNRQLKSTGAMGNEGALHQAVLKKFDIEPKTIIDIGANFGEVSLFFAKNFPASRIIAVEPAPDNIAILEKNLSSQFFDTGCIQLLKAAVNDRDGEVNISLGLGSENSIVTSEQKNATGTVSVPAYSIQSIFNKFDLDLVDYMKIDVEGVEPILKTGLMEMSGQIRSLLIEFSNKGDIEEYRLLLNGLLDSGYQVRALNEPDKVLNPDIAFQYYQEKLASGLRAIDFFFFKDI